MRPGSLVSVFVVLLATIFALSGCAATSASQPMPTPVASRDVEYMDGDTRLVGRLALPESGGGPHPAVLVVHEWWGRSAHAVRSAEELARLGYVALAVDMYGDARTTKDPEQAGAWAGSVRKNPAVERGRLEAALALVRSLPEVDGSRVACIGYCFGGTVSLDAAWMGLPLRGVVSFHGSLTTPTPEQAKGVTASILVCHGADDPLVSKESIDAFHASMRENGYDVQFVGYGGAVHSFTNPEADGSFNAGVKYHEPSARRSWALMRSFLEERLRGTEQSP